MNLLPATLARSIKEQMRAPDGVAPVSENRCPLIGLRYNVHEYARRRGDQ